MFWPKDINWYLANVAEDFRMRTIVSMILGTKEIRQINNQIYFRESGDGDEFAWHQDISFRTPPEDFQNIESGYLQTVIVVDPMYQENGAIEFIPRSHRWGDMHLIPRDGSELGLREFIRGDWSGIKIKANPGDVLVWNVMVVHGSEKNESGRNRMTYMNGFAREDSVLNKTRFPKYAI